MKKQTIKYTAITFSVLIILGLLGMAVYQQYAYQQMNDVWLAEQQKMVDLKAEIAQIEQSIEDYQKEQEEFQKLLFAERDVPAFLDEISKYAKMASMNIIDMKTQQFYQVQVPQEIKDVRTRNQHLNEQLTEEEKKQELERAMTLAAMPIQVKVKGTFAGFVEFLNQLQDYQQLLNIANVEIQSTNKYPTLDCQFTIRIYSLKTLAEMQRL